MMKEKGSSRSESVTSNDTPAAVAGRISASLDQAEAALHADRLALGAPMRTFTLNSREFYEAVRRPGTGAWIPNGALPPDPPARDPEAIIEPGKAKGRR
jgi:hypothetical protein